MLATLSRSKALVPAPLAHTKPIFSRLEWKAIRIGLAEGEMTLSRSRIFGLFLLFLGRKTMPLANRCLEALRAYAELARVLLPMGRAVPADTLIKAGFSGGQIAALNNLIAARVGGVQ